MDKFYVVRTPEPEDSPENKYLLMVSRGNPLAGVPNVFFVDRMQYVSCNEDTVAVQGLTKSGDVIVEFPIGTMFKVVRRDMVDCKTQLELMQEEKRDSEEIRKAMEPQPEDEAPLPMQYL